MCCAPSPRPKRQAAATANRKEFYAMNNLKRMLAALTAVTAVLSCTISCSKKDDKSSESSQAPTEEWKGEDEVDLDLSDLNGGETAETTEDMTLTWLSYYDINPSGSNNRSVALSLFEDVYGGKINYVQTTSEDKFSKLASMILAGDDVDMFPYEWDALPNGVTKNQYDPLDPYFEDMGMNEDGLWDDMEDVIDMFEYKGEHYVVPFTISDPLLVTYSRKMVQAEGLEDPYTLYENGEWDWDAFMNMMETFVANAPSGDTRYGINGWFGQAMIQSTGHTVINYDNGVFSNNIDDPEIEKAELLMQDIASKHLYRNEWLGNFPDDQSTLFYAMADWALSASNAKNPDLDLMVVPFPKSPDADDYYLCCNYGARMLVKNSKKGKAVATYIKCERLAATEDSYKEAAKEKALIVNKTAAGVVTGYVTEEQYDAIQSYIDPSNVTPMFDFGYGMGDRMYGSGDYTYETRGVMNNLTDTLLEGNEAVDSWAALRDAWTGVITEEVERFNSLSE